MKKNKSISTVAQKSYIIGENVKIGEGVKIWHGAQIASNAKVGSGSIIGNNVYIDSEVVVGCDCKIQSGASVFRGVKISDGVFIGPHVCFTNDKFPRAINPNGKKKTAKNWSLLETRVLKGASIGANSTILPGIKIGKWAMVAAGSVVTKNVPDFGLVMGNPAKLVGRVNAKGEVEKD